MSDFTTAARAEAERQIPALPPDSVDVTYPRSVIRSSRRAAFEDGAEWARDHLEAQEPTDAEVEATADVLEQMDGMDLEVVARAALSAARSTRGGTT